MRVLHVSNSDHGGGAALAAVRLNLSLIAEGCESTLVVSRKKTQIDSIKSIEMPSWLCELKNKAAGRLEDILFSPFYRDDQMRSVAIISSKYYRYINRGDADIVNLHWVQGGMLSVRDISLIKKPVVWTLHDSWPICGAEHHPGEWYGMHRINQSIKYEKRGNREILLRDIDSWCWERKKSLWRNIDGAIAPSRWMADAVSNSELFAGSLIKLIPNIVSREFFENNNKRNSGYHRKFGLSDGCYIVYSAAYISSRDEKNSSMVVELADILNSKGSEIKIVIAGQIDKNFLRKARSRKNICCLDEYVEKSKLADLFRSALAVIQFSRVESFGLVSAEALATGTPVVAFDSLGNRDVVIDGVSGFLVDSIGSLASRIQLLEFRSSFSDRLGMAGRDYAQKNWTEEVVARLYLEFYETIVKKNYDKLV